MGPESSEEHSARYTLLYDYKLTQLHIHMNGADLWKVNDHVNESSIVINTD